MNVIALPFAFLMRIFNQLTGSYAIALLLFALVVKIVMLPLSIKQQKTQIRTAKLRPKLAAIEKKYAGRTDRKTLEKKQQEIMELQQKEGVSPLGGCLPLLIQLPIILILYGVVQ
ncbi:MAG: membrane protein insertase YidC, partial [Clostridia bacterium]|nr:membrane protein insertase YidC [Clostridia bacterium]